jgi:hypothetical protein
MNWPYIHTLINHFPIILTVVGCAVLVLALITNRRGVWLYALATLTLSGLSVYPVHFTGDQAAHALQHTWYVVRDMVEAHDHAAGPAMMSILAMGAASAYAWWRMLRRERTGLPPVWLRLLVVVLAAAGIGTVTWAAYLGGKIIHESPKLTAPP